MRKVRWILPFAAAVVATPAFAGPPVYAVVVGIDKYKAVPELHGAVNDAELLESTLKDTGAIEVVPLLDGDATRLGFEDAVRRMAAKAAQNKGWLVITYAGHGSQEPEFIEGDEADKLDEFLVFANFGTVGERTSERLVDNEMRALLEGLPHDLNVLLVIDACHSGTMTRSPDPRAAGVTYRVANYGPIVDDQLPPPSIQTKGKEAADLPNVLFVASALDSEKTPELEIEGAKHGAVSWYVAKALRGEADINRDGQTTFEELRQFLAISPRALAQGRQTPSVSFFPGRETETFALAPAKQGETPIAPERLTVWSLDHSPIPGNVAPVANSAEQADLVWDSTRGDVIDNHTSDLIAHLPESADAARFLAGVIDKQHALSRLYNVVARDPLALDIGPRGAGARYAGGQVEIQVRPASNPALRYLTVFNIAGDGTVQPLFPKSSNEAGEQRLDQEHTFTNRVTPPYGADHVVAIATRSEPVDLRAMLESLNGQQAATQAINAVEQTTDAAVGVVGLYTGIE